jgi:hypothetical protein
MGARVVVDVDRDGRLVAIKRAATPGDVVQLRSEAAVLERARHPGVVELLRVEVLDGEPVLVLAHAGTRSLADAPLPHPAAEALLVSLCAIVADLHDLGVVHGRIEPSHVLVGGDGRPVLCGFGTAAQRDAPGDPATDVRALVELATTLLPDDPRTARLVTAAPTTATEVAAALSPGPARRSAIDPPDAARPRRPSRAARHRERRFLAAGIATLVAVLAVAVLRPPGAVDADTPSSASLDTSGAPVVDHEGRRYTVGRPGDVAVVGDWDCDGLETALVLRPSTGEVFAFSSWDDGAVVTPTTIVAGAGHLRRVDARPCDTWEAR